MRFPKIREEWSVHAECCMNVAADYCRLICFFLFFFLIIDSCSLIAASNQAWRQQSPFLFFWCNSATYTWRCLNLSSLGWEQQYSLTALKCFQYLNPQYLLPFSPSFVFHAVCPFFPLLFSRKQTEMPSVQMGRCSLEGHRSATTCSCPFWLWHGNVRNTGLICVWSLRCF